MLFNSYEYILVFLPITFLVYFHLSRRLRTSAANSWLIVASMFFYAWWNIIYLPLLVGSILFNYTISTFLRKTEDSSERKRKILLITGIAGNVSLLGYFKYADFFITNVNLLFQTHMKFLYLALPLAISFFTFQQIGFLIDSYKRNIIQNDFVPYALFVTFFPQLIAGPIVQHNEMMPQFSSPEKKKVNYKNISVGLFLFFVGLSKKVLIADPLSILANSGFDQAEVLTFFEAWATSFAYTFQLYFDFSGYTDMAIGAARMFNIHLPTNFASPYRALNIQQFWRQWHITLGRFLRKAIYIPLGGNRKSECRVYWNIMITFVIGGIWHGAGWLFFFWGFLHGLAAVLQRLWNKTGLPMHRLFAWLITFHFVNVAWIFFRAENWKDAIKVLRGMMGLNGIVFPGPLVSRFSFLEKLSAGSGGFFGNILPHIGDNWSVFPLLLLAFIICFFFKNSNELGDRFRPNFAYALGGGILTILSLFSLNQVTEFLYFNF